MDWEIEFSKLFKERENKKFFISEIGIVQSVDPLIVTMADGQIILKENKNLIVSETVKNIREFQDFKKLKIGDSVFISAITGGQKFIAVDRVVV